METMAWLIDLGKMALGGISFQCHLKWSQKYAVRGYFREQKLPFIKPSVEAEELISFFIINSIAAH